MLTKKRDFLIIFSVNSEIYIYNLLAKGKEEAVREILSKFSLENEDMAFRDIMERERLSSTLVSPAIAIPHAKSRSVSTFTYAVARSLEGVSWDGGQARIIILTLSPYSLASEHVLFLARIARFLEDDENVDRIMNAQSPEEMEEVFLNYAT